MVEDTATGEIKTETEAADRQRKFVEMIRNGTLKVSLHVLELFASTELISQARIIQTYFKADLPELASNDYIAKLTENADIN